MKLWLDDERPEPQGFVRARTSEEAITLLLTHRGEIEILSLDHDLGGEDTGYRVISWLEEKVALEQFPAPRELLTGAHAAGDRQHPGHRGAQGLAFHGA